MVDLGLVSTPLFYFARQELGIETGVMVTASHNPARDNGFKITLGPLPITEAEMAELAGGWRAAVPAAVGAPGRRSRLDLTAGYLDFVGRFAPDLSGLRVAVDCANGMSGLDARPVWQQSGANVTCLLKEVEGTFPAHPPNPAETKNLACCGRQVIETGADLGMAYDGDGDRVAFVDETRPGAVQDQAIVLLARAALSKGPRRWFTTRSARGSCRSHPRVGRPAVMERSGHTYIKRAFIQDEAAYAGELSGHHFCSPLAMTPCSPHSFSPAWCERAACPFPGDRADPGLSDHADIRLPIRPSGSRR